MLGLGHWWIIIGILAIVLIIYGPGKLPEVGGAIGRGIREFRKASTDLTDEIKRSTTQEPGSQGSTPTSETKPPTETKA
jgi:sec-independent protein translocase protein TatA